MFSEGGLTSPDIWIAVAIILIAMISIILNPLVFRHNLRKKRSLPRDIYMVLSTTDFTTSLALPTIYFTSLLPPKEDQCLQDHNATFCQIDYISYQRPATTGEKMAGSVLWYLVYAPITIACTLAIARWYQISFPLRNLNRTLVELVLVGTCLVQAVYFTSVIFGDTPERPTMMRINIQTVIWNLTGPFGIDSNSITIPETISTLQGVLAITTSILTIRSIIRSPVVPGNEEVRTRKMRSTIKVAFLNTGSVLYLFAGLVMYFMHDLDGNIRETLDIIMTSIPITLSSFNPVIYILLTDGVLSLRG